MDLQSLSKDMLILLVQNLEKELNEKIKEENKTKDSLIEELEFRVWNCNCEYLFYRCVIPECKAIALIDGKYENQYENCSKMSPCNICENYYCEKHFKCQKCQTCKKCCKQCILCLR